MTQPEKPTTAEQPAAGRRIESPSVSTAPARSGPFSRIPSHLGRARTSTVVLGLLFVGIFALWLSIKPAEPGTGSTTTTETGTEQPVPVPVPTTTAPETSTDPTTTAPRSTTSAPTTASEPTTDEEPSDTTAPEETAEPTLPTVSPPTTRATAPTSGTPSG